MTPNPNATTAAAFAPVPAALCCDAGMTLGWQAMYADAYRRAAEQVRAREAARRHTVVWEGRELTVHFATARNRAA